MCHSFFPPSSCCRHSHVQAPKLPTTMTMYGLMKLISMRLGSIHFETVLTIFQGCQIFYLTALFICMKTAAKPAHEHFAWNLRISCLHRSHGQVPRATTAQPESPNNHAASQHAQQKGTKDHRIKDIHHVGANNKG